MLRGINRQDIFEEQEDYQQFLIRLQNLIDPIDDNGEHIPSYFHVYAYCLMSNHVHLLLRERTESISISLKRLAVSYAAYYNKRYQRVGLRGHWHLEHPTDLQKKERMERNEILVEAIQYGIPLRQLSRLTGISYGVIQRINSKMKVGQ
jgi:REP element-mobilizing transposase RayT